MTFEEYFSMNMEFKDVELIEDHPDLIRIKTTVHDSDTNPYGYGHGGYLYTLCDMLCGLLGYRLGYYVLTQQASINYIRPAKAHEELFISAKALHSGKTSDVCDVSITDKDDRLIAKAQFTLFNTGRIEIE